MALEHATIYFSYGWLVVKPHGEFGPGFKVKLRFFVWWSWVSWNCENAADRHYIRQHGRAVSLRAAAFAAMKSLPFTEAEGAAERLAGRTPPRPRRRSR